ncbi:hypothetical protein Bpfe_017222 [Biomphalaria pfeifferi]|uniref:Uncharacterized protein n=1 Tax=Biomphalaria pfeifferi TaxID=112525 RepID=A0AAD8BEW4_BIOPF|nr:hypothetical protein Bpfe_017222 [Biomphalaria pfeifferi]
MRAVFPDVINSIYYPR